MYKMFIVYVLFIYLYIFLSLCSYIFVTLEEQVLFHGVHHITLTSLQKPRMDKLKTALRDSV